MSNEGRSLSDVANRRSGVKFFREGDRCLKLRNRRSGLWIVRGDQHQLFTPYPVLHKHRQDDKSFLDMKNYGV